jgi:hypothetical protein
MSNRRLIAMIRGRVTAGKAVDLSSLAARPQVVRALSRATLAVGAAGVVCALTAGVGGGLLTTAANAAVAGGGSYGSGPAPHHTAGRSTLTAPAEVDPTAVVGLGASAAPEPVVEQSAAVPASLQGIVAPATPAPVVAPGTVEAIISEVFGPHAKAAIGVAYCESRLRPTAISPNGANVGLFQINAVHRGRVARMGYRWEDLLDPRVNALVAKTIFDEQGWGPWACRRAAA